MKQRLAQFAEAVAAGKLRVDSEGIHLERQPASPEELRVSQLRRALYAGHGPGQIAEMMLHIDSKLRFSWLLLGREPYSRGELLLVYAAVLNLGTSMSAAEVARMVPGLERRGGAPVDQAPVRWIPSATCLDAQHGCGFAAVCILHSRISMLRSNARTSTRLLMGAVRAGVTA